MPTVCVFHLRFFTQIYFHGGGDGRIKIEEEFSVIIRDCVCVCVLGRKGLENKSNGGLMDLCEDKILEN